MLNDEAKEWYKKNTSYADCPECVGRGWQIGSRSVKCYVCKGERIISLIDRDRYDSINVLNSNTLIGNEGVSRRAK